MSKRFLALILAAISVFSLAACSAARAQLDGKYQLAEAAYPQMAVYPNESDFIKPDGSYDDDGFMKLYDAWSADRWKQLDQPEGYADELDAYLRTVIPALLGGDGGENKVCSPVNIYMALAMLAEVTDGESRGQILDLLGSGDIEELRAEASAVWNANYCADGALTSVLASSLWLNDQVSFKQPAIEALMKHYYASSFRGEMGSAAFDKALQDWVDKQTGGLLHEQASGLQMDKDTILALATTVYFRDRWEDTFSEGGTSPDIFHSQTGDQTCDFMHESGVNTYFWGDRFSAVAKRLANSGGKMWFLLPDEGVAPEELLADGQTLDFLLSGGEGAESKYLVVDLAAPKFDVAADTDLVPSLQAMGITDVFDYTIADFSPLTDDIDEVFLSKAEHAARVAIDEEGVTAVAYTVMMMECGSALPPEERVEFVLNRPFVFAVTGADGLPLFVGVVHQP